MALMAVKQSIIIARKLVMGGKVKQVLDYKGTKLAAVYLCSEGVNDD